MTLSISCLAQRTIKISNFKTLNLSNYLRGPLALRTTTNVGVNIIYLCLFWLPFFVCWSWSVYLPIFGSIPIFLPVSLSFPLFCLICSTWSVFICLFLCLSPYFVLFVQPGLFLSFYFSVFPLILSYLFNPVSVFPLFCLFFSTCSVSIFSCLFSVSLPFCCFHLFSPVVFALYHCLSVSPSPCQSEFTLLTENLDWFFCIEHSIKLLNEKL